jgi:hypothetical protein
LVAGSLNILANFLVVGASPVFFNVRWSFFMVAINCLADHLETYRAHVFRWTLLYKYQYARSEHPTILRGAAWVSMLVQPWIPVPFMRI